MAFAQAKLQELFDESEVLLVKCELNTEDEEFNVCDTSENIFVEPITLAEPIIDDEKHLIGSTIDTLDETKSRQIHDCDICQKTFTTAYNLTVRIDSHMHHSDIPL